MKRQFLTATEVAIYLGKSEWTIRQMARDEKLPAIKINEEWKFPIKYIEEYINAGLSGTNSIKKSNKPKNNT